MRFICSCRLLIVSLKWMAGLDSGTEGTVAIAGIDWFAGPSGPDNQADLDLC